MNLSEFVEEDNETFPVTDYSPFVAVYNVFQYVCLALGLPGNILSAIVWLRLHVAKKNSSAVYLAAVAINDIVYLLSNFTRQHISFGGWFFFCVDYLTFSTTTLEPLLVFGFSVERLIAICWPLQVGYVHVAYLLGGIEHFNIIIGAR